MWTHSVFDNKGFVPFCSYNFDIGYEDNSNLIKSTVWPKHSVHRANLSGLLRSSPQVYCESVLPKTTVLTTSDLFGSFLCPLWTPSDLPVSAFVMWFSALVLLVVLIDILLEEPSFCPSWQWILRCSQTE